jgi:hypothetical protein
LLNCFPVLALSISLQGFDYQLKVQQDVTERLEHTPVAACNPIFFPQKEWHPGSLPRRPAFREISFVSLSQGSLDERVIKRLQNDSPVDHG